MKTPRENVPLAEARNGPTVSLVSAPSRQTHYREEARKALQDMEDMEVWERIEYMSGLISFAERNEEHTKNVEHNLAAVVDQLSNQSTKRKYYP